MDILFVILRLLLGATFALAAAGKLLDREGARRALVGFGVPSPLVAPLVVLVPAGEILAALLLIPGATARAGALLSLLLLLLFILGIGVNLMRGRRPDCHCFGQFHSAPIGYKTLLRNTLLLVAALPLILSPRPHPSLFPWAALTAALLTLAILLTYLLQQNGRLLLRIEALENRLPHQPERPLLGLPVGAPAPDFQYRDTNLTHLLNRQIPLALIFTGPDCPACRDLDKDLLKLKQNVRLTSQVIEESGESRPIAESYRYAGTPSAVLVHPDGTIASPLAAGRDAVRRLLVASAAPGPGDPVPDLTLSDLDARTVPLRSLISGPTALLFWNPDCAFCQSLLPRLQAWEQTDIPGKPRLVLISSGTRDQLGASRLESPTLLDPAGDATQVFAAPGTPSALLAGADGLLASRVLAGEDGVMTLLTPESLEKSELKYA